MFIVLRVALAVVLTTFTMGSEAKPDRPEPWGRILLTMEQGTASENVELVKFLKSLSTEEMLLGARQACEEVTQHAAEMRDMPPEAVAEMYVMTCLLYYFDKVDRDEGGAALLEIVRDQSEPYLLRRAMISRMWETDVPFDGELQAYVNANETKVTSLLMGLVKDRAENPVVRKMAMECLAIRLGREVSRITRSDPGVHAIWERTGKVVRVHKLVRSGELALTEETLEALKPLDARTIAFVKVLGSILAEEPGPESDELHNMARARLESYKRSLFTQLDNEVEKALRMETGRQIEQELKPSDPPGD